MEPSCEVCGQYHGSVGEEEACARKGRVKLLQKVTVLEGELQTLRKENAKLAREKASILADALDLGRRLERYEHTHDKAAE